MLNHSVDRKRAYSRAAAVLATIATNRTGIGFVIALLVLLLPVFHAAARDCEASKGDSEIRCLSKGKAAMAGEVVTLKNKAGATVTFSIQEWYSHCGMDADDGPSQERTYALAPNASGRLFGHAISAICTATRALNSSSSAAL